MKAFTRELNITVPLDFRFWRCEREQRLKWAVIEHGASPDSTSLRPVLSPAGRMICYLHGRWQTFRRNQLNWFTLVHQQHERIAWDLFDLDHSRKLFSVWKWVRSGSPRLQLILRQLKNMATRWFCSTHHLSTHSPLSLWLKLGIGFPEIGILTFSREAILYLESLPRCRGAPVILARLCTYSRSNPYLFSNRDFLRRAKSSWVSQTAWPSEKVLEVLPGRALFLMIYSSLIRRTWLLPCFRLVLSLLPPLTVMHQREAVSFALLVTIELWFGTINSFPLSHWIS